MIKIKVTSRMSQEDYVALYTASPYILPKKHIFGVAITVILCAVLVLPMPKTWEYLTSRPEQTLTASEQEYLQSDQRLQELSAAASHNEQTPFSENYEDYDIPSQYFSAHDPILQHHTTTAEQAEIRAISSDEDIFVGGDGSTTQRQTASDIIGDRPIIAGTWADRAPTTTTAGATLSANNTESNSTLAATDASSEATTPASDQRPQGKWYRYTVKSGDNFSAIFNYLDLPYATLNRITKVASGSDLNLSIGDNIYFLVDEENVIKEVVKNLSNDQQVRFTRNSGSDDFKAVHESLNSHISATALGQVAEASTMPHAAEVIKERAEKNARLAAAQKAKEERDRANNVNPHRPRLVINSLASGESFAQAGHRAGLTPSEVKTITQLFANKVDFKKMHRGDSFRVLFTGIGTSALISAVHLETTQGTFETFMNPEDQNYYGENEYTPTAGVFRRFPLAGDIKINSQFNPNRRHPVTRRISPHNGVDFKASVGTPVYAPADGVVSFAGYQRAAGYYVIVRHINNYSTVYMHLSKYEVKRGQKVTAGQLIARSGNTGRTTGPHLHYEVRINDRPVNPLKIKLPTANHPNLAREQREAFANNVKILRADLQNDRLALAQP
ncbi:MAG: peptidoglycan DD-metalloendopeptidase family protein [Candidatus Anaerobiospirillum pullicola]|uniref:Peptidoglycan DD-metalloendopeptidase family protein n=1 Tax=Candidatus Anaerobiospirillum pullicola TaxID=2838451 RepID=A0A948TGQ1_9GAMM|nr:peptidoglycan DD-metalloendopeptidase family protein [Candidatus Anaerobiospirillum pullicola]